MHRIEQEEIRAAGKISGVKKSTMNIIDLWQSGGMVIWPLMFFSILAVALIIERITFWIKISGRQDHAVRDVLNFYRQGNVVSALNHLHKNTDLPMARIFLAALELEEPTPEEFRLALETEAQAEIPLLKRFQNIFDTIIAIAPLLGLLGTVLGLIGAFASLNIGDLSATKTTNVTGGISEALVSTAAGLILAIFTLFFANTFRGLYIRQMAWIQEYGGQLELLYRRHYEKKY